VEDEEGEVGVQGVSEWDGLPGRLRVGDPGPDADAIAIRDLETANWPVLEPPGFWEQVRLAGWRSMLVVRLTVRDQRLGLQFWSKRAHAFDERQLGLDRRIADHVSLA